MDTAHRHRNTAPGDPDTLKESGRFFVGDIMHNKNKQEKKQLTEYEIAINKLIEPTHRKCGLCERLGRGGH